MIVQLKDCIDVLQHLFPEFNYIFLFDQNNGHNILKPNGLSLNKINLRYSGTQPKMRLSTTTADLLGPYHNELYPIHPGMNHFVCLFCLLKVILTLP